MNNKSFLHRSAELFIVLVILVVLLGKLFYKNRNSTFFLISYGIIVTSVTWATIAVSFYLYKDPYKLALEKERNHKKLKNPLVSCMVAVKNEENNIARCVDSMLRQSYKNKEVIVVNDASTDKTLNVLKEYEKDKKIILINLRKNVGKKRALGKAMAIAKGEFFAHTDSDSVWAPDAIGKIIKIFQ